MSRRLVPLLISLLLIAAPVSIQAQDCGHGLPCGPLPWRLPQLPVLGSPTPFPTVLITAAPTAGPTSTGTVTETPTVTPTPSPTSLLDAGPIMTQVGTLEDIVSATQETIFDRATGFDLSRNAGGVVGFVLGLQDIHFGIFTPLIQLAFFALFFIIGLKLTFLLLPLLASFVGLIRKIISLILDFIPG